MKLLPMPVWEPARIEITAGKVTLFANLTFLGWPIHISETFHAEGSPGGWTLAPEAASVGLLDLPERLLKLVTPVIRAGIAPFESDLTALAASQSLVIYPGMIEFTTR